jgi:hypothetical protein
MTFIGSIYIPFVEKSCDANYIMDMLYCQGIATVGRVTILPNKNKIYNRAYVEIHEWHDSEAAYGFVNRLLSRNVETRFVHSDDNWWRVEINYKPELSRTAKNKPFTVINYLATDDDSFGDNFASALAVMGSEFDELSRLIDNERANWQLDLNNYVF